MKINLLMLAFGLMLCTGCSHNCITYSDGIGLRTSINPQTYTIGIDFLYGKILNVVARENTEIELNGKGGVDSATSTSTPSASADSALKIKIGKQISGYYVDALAAGAKPKQLKDYLTEDVK